MKLRWVLIGAAAGALFVAERLRPLRITQGPGRPGSSVWPES